jgi:hypothetical protein
MTNGDQEASSEVAELHEDDPDYFEFMLKSIYTSDYDKKDIEELAGGAKTKRATIPIGIHQVADKYDISNICERAGEDIKGILEAAKDDIEILEHVIHEYYAHAIDPDEPMGKSIVAVLLKIHQAFIKNSNFEDLLMSYPVFGADVALTLQRSKSPRLLDLLSMQHVSCPESHFGISIELAKLPVRSYMRDGAVCLCPSCGEGFKPPGLT